MPIEPLAIGVCSWSLQVKSIPELKGFVDRLGINLVQIACGDPHHADWAEGEQLPQAALAAGFTLGGAMLGFPGEDYTTPQHIQRTGGFGDPATRPERLERFKWALQRTLDLGVTDLMLHAGFIPEVGEPERKPFLDTLTKVSQLAAEKKITIAFETGQESSALLRRTLDDLKCPNLKVNFDPANMILYGAGEPIAALEKLGHKVKSVHCKDGTWAKYHSPNRAPIIRAIGCHSARACRIRSASK